MSFDIDYTFFMHTITHDNSYYYLINKHVSVINSLENLTLKSQIKLYDTNHNIFIVDRKNKEPGTDRGVHRSTKRCAKTYCEDNTGCFLEERFSDTHQQCGRQARDPEQ